MDSSLELHGIVIYRHKEICRYERPPFLIGAVNSHYGTICFGDFSLEENRSKPGPVSPYIYKTSKDSPTVSSGGTVDEVPSQRTPST